MKRIGIILLAAAAVLTPACQTWDGHFSVAGYSTKPNYDLRFKTVRVPVCKTRTNWTVTPTVGMEMDLQRAIVREVQTKTPYRVVQENAETELVCTIVGFQKNLLNYTQFNTVREAETVMVVELVWRDTRTGEILLKRSRRVGDSLDPVVKEPLVATTPDSLLPPGSKPIVGPATPTVPMPGAADGDDELVDPLTKRKIQPVIVRSTAHFRPELGESITTAMQKNIDRIAVQIVSVMELGDW